MVSVTQQAHDFVQSVLIPGELAIDATAGNGHDTLFLAQLVTSTGKVWAIDIQPEAISQTRRRLAQQQIEHVELLIADHAQLDQFLSQDFAGQIGAVMLNLGYLPGTDHKRITQPQSTLAALEQSTRLLRNGGCLSIVVYYGHPGGAEEAQAVAHWISTLPAADYQYFSSPQAAPRRGPQLYAVRKFSHHRKS